MGVENGDECACALDVVRVAAMNNLFAAEVRARVFGRTSDKESEINKYSIT